jgi:hypothetical protein
MKKITFAAWAVLLFLLIGLSTCQTDTATPDPVDKRANFLGGWSVNENWTKLTYDVYITSDPNSSDGIYIEKFAGSVAGVKAHANVSGNTISIAPLPQTLSNGLVIESGSGNLQGTTKINWSYVFNDGADTYNANAVYTKR